MACMFHEAGLNFALAHCNFNLRGAESDVDEQFVATLAKKFRVPFFSRSFNTTGDAKMRKISIQMAARELRYTWFEELRQKEGFDLIATAHHLDDQIETFFINLLRGTGISGMHGILPKQGYLIRPILFLYRDEIEAYITRNHIRYRTDKSNQSKKYLRNRIRLELVPLLCSLNPDFRTTMTDNIRRFRDSEVVYQREIDRVKKEAVRLSKSGFTVSKTKLSDLSPQSVYLFEIFSEFGFNESMISDLLQSLQHSESRVFESADWHVLKDRDEIVITRRSQMETKEPGEICSIPRGTKSLGKPVALKISEHGYKHGSVIPGGRETASLDLDKLEFPLHLRRWQAGDAFFPFGMKGKKKVSDFLTDQKIPKEEKDQTWILLSGKKIAWVVGQRIDNRFRITPRTTKVFRVVCKGDS